MAVPKAKRSKQATTTYRSNKLIKTLAKYSIKPKSSFNYLNPLPELATPYLEHNPIVCWKCKNLWKKVCLNCYTSKFKGAYIKYIKNYRKLYYF